MRRVKASQSALLRVGEGSAGEEFLGLGIGESDCYWEVV